MGRLPLRGNWQRNVGRCQGTLWDVYHTKRNWCLLWRYPWKWAFMGSHVDGLVEKLANDCHVGMVWINHGLLVFIDIPHDQWCSSTSYRRRTLVLRSRFGWRWLQVDDVLDMELDQTRSFLDDLTILRFHFILEWTRTGILGLMVCIAVHDYCSILSSSFQCHCSDMVCPDMVALLHLLAHRFHWLARCFTHTRRRLLWSRIYQDAQQDQILNTLMIQMNMKKLILIYRFRNILNFDNDSKYQRTN